MARFMRASLCCPEGDGEEECEEDGGFQTFNWTECGFVLSTWLTLILSSDIDM